MFCTHRLAIHRAEAPGESEYLNEVGRLHNAEVSSRASKRIRGTIGNLANQLAQIAAGGEASFDGPVLLREPATGRYVIDLVLNVSVVNGRAANLGMAALLEKWLQGELGRLGRDRDWLSKAMVEVTYELLPSDAFMDSHPAFWTSLAFVAHLSATVSVATPNGTAEASFTNDQAVIGKSADHVRPMPTQYLPTAARGRPVQIKSKVPGKRRPDA
jgi:hypothetical protein